MCNAKCAVSVAMSSTSLSWRGVSLGPQKPIEILQLQLIDKMVDFCCAGPADSSLLSVRRHSRSHSCSLSYSCLDKVVDIPVGVQRQMLGGSECRKLRRSRSCSTSDKVVDVPVGAVHQRFGRPRDHAATVATEEVPQIQFIAGVRGQSSCATENGTRLSEVVVMAEMKVFFGLAPRCPGVERQFLEPSMAKISLPSRAPLHNS